MTCGHCPCPAICPRGRVCDLLNPEHSAYDPRYAEIICGLSRDASPNVTPRGRRLIERILLYKSCDYRGPVAQCGCTTLRVCWQGKGSRPDPEASYGHVTERHCLACVSGAD